MLTWVTIGGGLLTELWSRPHKNPDGTYDMTRWTGDPLPSNPGVAWNRLTVEGKKLRRAEKRLKRQNYMHRMVPHVIAIFPYVSMWTIILNNFFEQLEDLRVYDPEIYERVPDFVPAAVLGSVGIFSLFTFPQWWWQYAPPMHYWKVRFKKLKLPLLVLTALLLGLQTEIVYCLLSATSKVFLGALLYSNVLLAASFDEAVSLTNTTTTMWLHPPSAPPSSY